MTAIYLCEALANIRRVYSDEIMSAIANCTDICGTPYSKADIIKNPELFSNTEVIFSTWGMPQFTEDEIRSCFPRLKYLFYAAGSVQSFARPFLACGVRVFSAWAANAVPVAEMTCAQIILANKGYYLSSRLCREKSYRDAAQAHGQCRGNYGETVGIIGAGMIGSLVIRMLRAYKLKVIVFDPFLSNAAAAELGVEKCSLEELFSRAFTISNHLANNERTKGMLGGDLFRLMRQNAVFINTGRGAQVVEDDLAAVLTSRPDLTALLDVTDPEPPCESHPFYTLPNCILTPHIAGSSGDEVVRMADYMLGEFERCLRGEPCLYEVSVKMLETMA